MEGGPLALVHDGDTISIDIPNRKLELEVSDEELAKRRAAWKQPEPKVKTGYLSRYAKLVTSANTGASCSKNEVYLLLPCPSPMLRRGMGSKRFILSEYKMI